MSNFVTFDFHDSDFHSSLKKAIEYCEATDLDTRAGILATQLSTEFEQLIGGIYAPTKTVQGVKQISDPINLSVDQLHELKTSANQENVNFVVLNNKMSYQTFNKTVFSVLGLVQGYDLTSGAGISIESFLNPVPPTAFDTATFADTILTALTNTNVLGFSYAITGYPDYMGLFSTYPTTKKQFETKLLNVIAGGNLYLSDYFSYASKLNQEDQGLLVFVVANQGGIAALDNPASCAAISSSELTGKNTQIYMIPYKLIKPVITPPVEAGATPSQNNTPNNLNNVKTETTQTIFSKKAVTNNAINKNVRGSSRGSSGSCTIGSKYYADVKETDPNYPAVEFVTEEEILSGKPNPDKSCNKNIIDLKTTITRIEYAKIATILAAKFDSNAAKITAQTWQTTDGNLGFKDLNFTGNNNEWMRNYVKHGYLMGLFTGYVDSTFRPTNTISFSEFMKVTLPATKNATVAEFKIQEYVKADQPWYVGVMQKVKALGLTEYSPTKALTRGDTIRILYELNQKGFYKK